MQAYILGIDIGTGSTKAVAVSITGKVLASAQHYYPISSPQSGFSEQDPELIWQAFADSIVEVVTKLKHQPVAVSLSAVMHSFIAVDGDGQALAPMMTFADTRSADIADDIKNSPEAENIYRVSGTPIHPMSPLCKLIWLRQNNPGLFKKAHRFIAIKTFIWYRLFKAYQIDYSVACGDGLFDIINLCWNDKLCALAQIETARLAQPVNTTYSRCDLQADIAKQLHLTATISFVIGASDGCCANLGSGATSPGVAALTIGSSGAVRITSAAPVYNFKAMTFNYLLNEKTFVCGGAINNGGLAVDWLLKNFLQKDSLNEQDYAALFANIDAVPPGSDGLIFLPYLYGERAPVWDAKSSGAFLNIRFNHGQSHFLRAVIEGICFALNSVLQAIEQTGARVDQVNISGGFVSSATWVQMMADVTGKKLAIVNQEDASAMGAVYLAMQSLKIDHQHLALSGLQKNKQDSIFISPDASNHQIYQSSFKFYRKFFADLKDTMHLFHDMQELS